MKNLVIVESPSKSKTIEKYLGNSYKVVSSKGHIRDLKTSGKYGFGVDVDNNFAPSYEPIKGKQKVINDLKKLNEKNYNFKGVDKVKLYLFIFIAGAFAGYIYEVIFELIESGTFVNKGFYYGPYLPVYGVGAVFLSLILNNYKKHPFLVFVLGILITGIVEYITGYAMYKIFHKKWWDYTGLFLNIDSYVCFRSVFTFAIGGMLLIYIVEPLIKEFISTKSKKITNIISIVFIVIFVIDVLLSFLIRNKI